MNRLVTVELESQGTFRAKCGDRLLEAALMNGFDIPHDCRSGICGTCRVRIVSGTAEGGTTGEPDAVLACQAKVCGPVKFAVDELPAVETISARVTGLVDLAHDVCEVALSAARSLSILPGQYCQFRFKGFATRCYSPTIALTGTHDNRVIRLHVRRVRGGQVSGALGKAIRKGHRVKVTGPFGSAYFRPGNPGRLVLIATGTGFAPIWSIAHAALCEMPDRPIYAIVGSRTRDSLYMAPALLRLATFPKVRVIPVLASGRGCYNVFPIGNAVDFLPQLQPTDRVYAAGSPAMVSAVEVLARASGARCYSDAFLPQTVESESLFARARQWLAARPTHATGPGLPAPRLLRQVQVQHATADHNHAIMRDLLERGATRLRGSA